MIASKYSRHSTRASLVIFFCFGNGILSLPSGQIDSNDPGEKRSTDIQGNYGSYSAVVVESQGAVDGRRERNIVESENATTRPDNSPESQNFFQSFAPLFGGNNNSPLGHSRPLLYPEHSYKPAFKMASYRELPATAAFGGGGGGGASDNILGSGNFGVVKGGTYYAEERDDADFVADNDPYSFLGSTHGRVYKKNPPPAFRNGGDFFAHFRDFADITAPSKSYSQYYVVYVNKNATVDEAAVAKPKQPKNIIEQLNMLDSASASEEPLKAFESTKLSKFKRKLVQHRARDREKEASNKSKLRDSPKEIAEPLLALS